jgi:hypothetical protein
MMESDSLNGSVATRTCASGPTPKAVWSAYAASLVRRAALDWSAASETRRRRFFTIGCQTPAPSMSARTTTYVPLRSFISPRGPAVGRVGPTSPLSSIFRRCSTEPTRRPELKRTEASRCLLRPFVGWHASPTSSLQCLARTGYCLTSVVHSDWPHHINGERFG